MVQADSAPPHFVDVTRASGIAFIHGFGDSDMNNIVEATGSGCCFFDYNNDGYIDIYLVNGSYQKEVNQAAAPETPLRNELFHNNGDGTFKNITAKAGVGDAGYGMGCVAGDYDNDGHQDLYITNFGRNTLYHNNGDGTFSDVTAATNTGDTHWGVGTTFFDYDNDGYLDLFVGNYLEFDPSYRLYYAADRFPGPLAYPGQKDILYRNNGDGTFRDVSAAAGITKEGRAMGVVAADYNDDGWVDLFVANDAMENYLYRNNGNGTFTDEGLLAGVAFSQNGAATSSMGGDFGDFDGDGDLDLFVPDMTFNSFYLNQGNGTFTDISARLGIAEVSGQYWSWGGSFVDYDNDGDLDLIISNGHGHRLDTQEDLILANVQDSSGSHRYRDATDSAGSYFRHKSVSRGLAVGDFNNDGAQDILINNIDQPSVLLKNSNNAGSHWIMLLLHGTKSNRDGVGARVTLTANAKRQIRNKVTASGYLSQSDPRLHFGLDAATTVDSIEIKWPSGRIQKLEGIKVDQIMTVVEPGE